MISNVLCKYFANSTNSTVHLLCSAVVLAGEQTQRDEMSHVFSVHVKWRSYGLVTGQKNQRVRRRGGKNGSSSQNCPWLMSSVFQWLNIGFQPAPTLIPDQSPVDLLCNTAQRRPALGSVPCWTSPCSAVLPETLIFTFYLPKTMSGNRKMMKQSLSFLWEAKGLLKITIWGKVVLHLHLLCTERGKRKWVRERESQTVSEPCIGRKRGR